MPLFSEKRIRTRVLGLLESGAKDDAIIAEIQKRNAGLDPATWAIIVKIILEVIKAWRENKKKKPTKKSQSK